MMTRIASEASSALREPPSTRRAMNDFSILRSSMLPLWSQPSWGVPSFVPRAVSEPPHLLQEVREKALSLAGHDRLGVELDPFDRHRSVPQPHHRSVLGPGGDLERLGHRV